MNNSNMDNSDDEYELVQCEEILISDSEEVDPLSEASSSRPKIPRTSDLKLRNINFDLLPDATKLKYIRRPTRPVRLFSFTDRDILNRFSEKNEASKSLAMQLLNIVKSVNMKRKVKIENGIVVPNFYLIATECECKKEQKVTKLESTDIVNLIKDIIHMIKIGMYRDVDFVEIICDSPAIFLIKYINVKNWAEANNAVYVVTSEYLLPYLCKIKAAEEQEKRAGKRIKANKSDEESPLSKKKMEDIINAPFGMVCSKEDQESVEAILNKHLEPDAVRFFVIQMKISGLKQNQYRWTDEDKALALKLLKGSPSEYNILFQRYALPSDKTLQKFVCKIRKKVISRKK